jgi:hypothetical protein
MSSGFDLSTLLLPATLLFGTLTFLSGVFLVVRSVVRFRIQINRSIAMDLEVIQVTKKNVDDKNSSAGNEPWKEEVAAMEQLLGTLASMKRTIGWRSFFYETPNIIFEVANPADKEEIFFYFAVPKKFRESIEKQIHGFFPDSVIEKVSDYTIFSPGCAAAFSTLELSKSHALPIKSYRALSTDPLSEMTNALSRLGATGEGAAIQFVLTPAGKGEHTKGKEIAQKMQSGKRLKDAEGDSIVKEMSKGLLSVFLPGKKEPDAEKKEMVSLTPEEQELVKTIDSKASKPAFKVNIRLVAAAKEMHRAEEILAHIENTFSQFENIGVNAFRVRKRVKGRQAAFDYIYRNFDEENAVILSTEEVASIFHFPTSQIGTPKIKWLKAGAAPPPVDIPKDGMLLGYNDYRGAKTDIRITESDRRRHMYVIGQTGVGKSVYLQEMAKKDARAGHGFCFIDPHGDAIEDILTAIPKERAEDVILFDPSDTGRPIGLNMLEFDPNHPEQKTFVINEMIGIFDQLSKSS